MNILRFLKHVPLWGRTVARVVMGGALIAFVAILGLSWRLSMGPIDMSDFKPYIMEALPSDQGITLTFKGPFIAWHTWTSPIAITLHDINLAVGSGIQGHAPSAIVSPKLLPLLVGKYHLETLTLQNPTVAIDGALFEGPKSQKSFWDVLDVSHLVLTNAVISLRQKDNKIWKLPRFDVVARHAWGAASLDATLYTANTPTTLHGTFDKKGEAIEATMTAHGVPVDALPVLWPEGVAQNARDWITVNMKSGIVHKATVAISGTMKDRTFDLSRCGGSLAMDGLTVDYLKGLPPATDVSGSATFDQHDFHITIAGGHVGNLRLNGGTLLIKDMDKVDTFMTIDLATRGPAKEAALLIAKKPLEFAQKINLDPKTVKGEATILQHYHFILEHDLTFDDVELNIKAAFKNLEGLITLGGGKLPLLQSKGRVTLDVTQSALKLVGSAHINGVPSSIVWDENFKEAGKFKRNLVIKGVAKSPQVASFKLDVEPYIKGDLPFILTYSEPLKGKATLSIKADLKKAAVVMAFFSLQKPSGDGGTLDISASLDKGHFKALDQVTLKTSGHTLVGTGQFNASGDLKEFSLPSIDTKNLKGSLSVSFENEVPAITVHGHYLNLEPFLASDESPKESMVQVNPKSQPFSLDLNLTNVWWGGKYPLRSLVGKLKGAKQADGIDWTFADLKGQLGRPKSHATKKQVPKEVRISLTSKSPGVDELLVEAPDGGKLLKYMDVYDGIDGGVLRITATRKKPGPFRGTFYLDEFDILDVPSMTNLLHLLSPLGIMDILRGNRLAMSDFQMDFSLTDDILVLINGRGHGASIGFTMKGRVNRKPKTMALRGNVVPMDMLNSIISNIPILGYLITGGSGNLFAMNFSMKGPIAAPIVDVNPLSVLAPGFLRELLDTLGDKEDDDN